MSLSILLFALLSFWIYKLQNRIFNLENQVNSFKNNAEEKSINSKQNDIIKKKVTIKDELPIKIREETLKIFAKTRKEELKSKEPSELMEFFKNYFTQGNLLVRIGGIILFFGLAFLAKYAAEYSTISMQTRLIFIALTAIALVALGWKLRNKDGIYGQVLQGLGIAIFYLVIYVASKFYALLSFDIAFILMLMTVVLGSLLAVIENSQPLAIFSTIGGFIVPILVASNSGSHVALFSYYALLNLAIFIQAWYHSWRLLNILGFICTFAIAVIWGVLRYKPELFVTTEPFLVLFFVMYLTISILFTLKHSFKPKNFIDGALVFGLPMVVFPLQLQLVQNFEYAQAISAIILGVLYFILSRVFKNNEKTDLLAQVFLLLSVVFFTISIPYIFDADVTAALWSLESCVAIWIALKQNRTYSRYLGEILLLVSALIYPLSVYTYGITFSEYLGYIIVITAIFIASYLLDKNKKYLSRFDIFMPIVFLGFSIVLWFFSTPLILMKYNVVYVNSLMFSLFLAGGLFFIAIKYLNYNLLIKILQVYLVLGIYFFFIASYEITHPFEGFGVLILGSFFLFNYFLLYKYDKFWKYIKQIHILSIWFMASVLVLEIIYFAKKLDVDKSIFIIAIAIIPLVSSIFLLTFKKYGIWLEKYKEDYQFIATGGFIFVLVLWELRAFNVAPDFNMLTYVPILNPIDMMQLLVLGLVSFWIYRNQKFLLNNNKLFIYGLTSFLFMSFFTVVFARSIHMYGNVNYDINSLWHDMYFQTGLSILWSIIAITAMFLSKRYASRIIWLAGFGLLVLVVLKLFLVELDSSGTIERIISFIIVGSLLLFIGYFVPLPPTKNIEKIVNIKENLE